MDPTSHIPSVTLFHYLNGSMPLTNDGRYHLDHCAYCQSVVAEYKKYIDPAMIPAACNLGDREQLRHQAMERRQFARSPAETAHPMPIPSTR